MIGLLWAVCASVFVSYDKQCHNCGDGSEVVDYSAAIDHMGRESEIVIRDEVVNTARAVDMLSNMCTKAFKKGVKVDGGNVAVDGTLSRHYFPAFFTVEASAVTRISNFRFADFAAPIIHAKSEVVLEHIYVDSCSIDRKISLFAFSEVKAEVRDMVIERTTVHDTSLISCVSADVVFSGITFTNVFTYHAGVTPFILVVGANLSVHESMFRAVGSPNSPMFTLCERSRIELVNVSFRSNQNSEIVLCEEGTTAEICACMFDDNWGSILAGDRSSISVKGCLFNDNFAPAASLFGVTDTLIQFVGNLWANNTADYAIVVDGVSDVVFELENFVSNRGSCSLIWISNGTVRVDNSTFTDNSASNHIVTLTLTNATLSRTLFADTWGVMVGVERSLLHMKQAVFRGTTSVPSIASTSSTLAIEDTQFATITNTNVIKSESDAKVILSHLTFSAPADRAVSGNISEKCTKCVFGEHRSVYGHQPSLYPLIVLALLFILPLLFRFRRYLCSVFHRFTCRKNTL